MAGWGHTTSGAQPFRNRRPLSTAVAKVLAGLRAISAAARDAAEQRRLFLLWPPAFLSGIIAYRALTAEPALLTCLLMLAAALAAVLAARGSHTLLRLSGIVLVGTIGFCALPTHGVLFGTPMLSAPAYGAYTARIDQVIYDDGQAQRWIISDIAGEPEWAVPEVKRARIFVSEAPEAGPGDRFAARIRFYPVPAPAVPGGYDAQFVGYFDGIGAYGSVLGDLSVTPSPQGTISRTIETARSSISQRVYAVLGNRIGGIAAALITGNQSRISEHDRDLMASAGLAHVLAISGLHLTLVAGTMFAAVRLILSLSYVAAQSVPVKKIAAVAGLLTACAYLVISGMGVSAIRATIMLSLVFAAVVAGRQALTMRNVAIAALLIAAIEPTSIFRASYQLSFAAVIALIAAYELYRDQSRDIEQSRSKIIASLAGIATTSIIAGLATLLFTAYHFQQTAPFGVVGNLLAMPVVTFVMMPAALVATLLIPVGLDQPFFALMGSSIEWLLWCAELVRTLSGGFDPSPILAPAALIVGLMALTWLAFFRDAIRLLGPVVAVPVIVLFCQQSAPDVLIADQTQAVAVRHGGDLALISGRTNTFATNVWSERYLEPVSKAHENSACGSLGCFLHSNHGFTVALVRDRGAFLEDCRIADLVITRIEAPPDCSSAGAEVIDDAALKRSGTHALRWNSQQRTFAIETAIQAPERPWRPQVRQ